MMGNRVIGRKGILMFLILTSAAAIVFAFYYLRISNVVLHDSNFETFQSALTADQTRGIMHSLDSITAVYTWLLVITNVFWICGLFLLERRKGA